MCPRRAPDYLPTCWRAGEIIRARCVAAGVERRASASGARARRARTPPRRASPMHRTVPGAHGADWLDAGQCRDCRDARLQLPPGRLGAVHPRARQLRRRRAAAAPLPLRLHRRRATTTTRGPAPATRRSHRRGMTESLGGGATRAARSRACWRRRRRSRARSSRVPSRSTQPGFQIFETERQASFLTTGGLVAVHADGRDRDAIWDALRAPRGLRHHRPAHAALVRPAEPAGLARRAAADGRRDGDGPRPDLPGARGRLLRAAAGLPRLPRAEALGARATRAPLQGRVLPPVGPAPADHAHRDRAHPPAARARARTSAR